MGFLKINMHSPHHAWIPRAFSCSALLSLDGLLLDVVEFLLLAKVGAPMLSRISWNFSL